MHDTIAAVRVVDAVGCKYNIFVWNVRIRVHERVVRGVGPCMLVIANRRTQN